MSNLPASDWWASKAPQLLSILRIAAALIFIPSGTMKLFGWPQAMPNGAEVELWSQVGIGGILELLGGFLLLIGLSTRPVAFILSGTMAVAYWQFHGQQDSLFPSVNMGTPAALFCFVFLYVSAAGGGPWSIDALARKSK